MCSSKGFALKQVGMAGRQSNTPWRACGCGRPNSGAIATHFYYSLPAEISLFTSSSYETFSFVSPPPTPNPLRFFRDSGCPAPLLQLAQMMRRVRHEQRDRDVSDRR